MDFFDVIEKRRSVRRFSVEPVPDEVVRKAFHAAVLAPNSSNTQTWDFYWVKSPDKKQALVKACLSQSAARKAQHLVVITANPQLWRRSQKPLLQYVQNVQAGTDVQLYYKKLVPLMYMWGPLNILALLKWILATLVGIFRPIMRGPLGHRDIQEVAVKSAALACENFVLAITAQGFASCMMEGFDEWRVRRLLRLKCHQRVVMVIAVGREAESAHWGPRFRLPLTEVVHEV